jgi:cell division protein FtsQ
VRNWIKKIAFVLWLLFGVAVTITLVAAIRKKDQSICKTITIQIEQTNGHIFLSEKEIEQLLVGNNTSTIINKPLQHIDLRALENILLANIWIQKANLFFDNNNVLHVHVAERTPIARVFEIWGKSFYIDSSCTQLPLVQNIHMQLPVFTNFPFNGNKLTIQDSMLLHQIKDISTCILADSFWMAQIQQIDITSERNFEMIPTIGNHLIVFGDAINYKNKFGKLKTFYEKAWAKVGLEKYAILDLRFDRQIIATRKGAGTIGIDTAQAKLWMQKLMKENTQQTDSVGFSLPALGVGPEGADSAHIATIIDQPPTDSIKLDSDSITKKISIANKKNNMNKQKTTNNKPVIKKPKVHL